MFSSAAFLLAESLERSASTSSAVAGESDGIILPFSHAALRLGSVSTAASKSPPNLVAKKRSRINVLPTFSFLPASLLEPFEAPLTYAA